MAGLGTETGLRKISFKKYVKKQEDSSFILIKALKRPLGPAGSTESSSSVSQHNISAASFMEVYLLKSSPR